MLRMHNLFDIAAGIVLIASPWIFGFADEDANFWAPHVIVGAAAIVLGLVTQQHPRRRRCAKGSRDSAEPADSRESVPQAAPHRGCLGAATASLSPRTAPAARQPQPTQPAAVADHRDDRLCQVRAADPGEGIPPVPMEQEEQVSRGRVLVHARRDAGGRSPPASAY